MVRIDPTIINSEVSKFLILEISESSFTNIIDEKYKRRRSGIRENSPYVINPIKVPKIPMVKIDKKSVSPIIYLINPISIPRRIVPIKILRNITQIDCFTIFFI